MQKLLHKLAPEKAHDLAIWALHKGLAPVCRPVSDPVLASNIFGLDFANPVGLAAGFDKNAYALPGLAKLGFGFIETGSVTPRPQSGNPAPRIFRLTEDEAIINRLGFNNKGIDVFLDNLQKFRSRAVSPAHPPARSQAAQSRPINDSALRARGVLLRSNQIIIGINIGANKTSENFYEDYLILIERTAPVADYITINISSPNTPGLRDLQKSEAITKLLKDVVEIRDAQKRRPPLLVKIAPDLTAEEIFSITDIVQEIKLDGIIATNTTIARTNLKSKDADEAGGLSGKPLRDASTEVIRKIYKHSKGAVKIIGVGGIFNGQEAFDKIAAGASLVQVYTGFIYQGPGIVKKINLELAQILKEKGFSSLSDAIGCGKIR